MPFSRSFNFRSVPLALLCTLVLVTFLLGQIALAEDELRVRIRNIAISTNFDSLDETIDRRKLLAFVNKKRREYPKAMSYPELQEVNSAITKYLRSKGYKFHFSVLPVQDLNGGSVTFSINQVVLGDIEIVNDTRVGDKVFRDPFDGLMGKPVYQPDIDRVLMTLRGYPQVKVFAYYSKGSTPNAVRLNVKVRAVRGTQLLVKTDNYGSISTGEERLLIQGYWKNPTHTFDRLSIGALVSNGETLNRYGYLAYTRPVFGLKNRLSASVSNNVFEVGGDFSSLELNGDATIFRLGFERDLPSKRDKSQTMSLFYESRTSEFRDLVGSSDPLDEKAQLYGASWNFELNPSRAHKHQFSLMLGRGSHTLGDREERSYQKSNIYYSLMLVPERWMESRGLSQFLFGLRGQYALQKVSSFDQISLTGASGVRALKPGQFSADTGYIASLQWRLPRLFSGKGKPGSWRCTPFTFIDSAWGKKLDDEEVDGETLESATFSGAGAGLIVSHRKGFTAKFSGSTALSSEASVYKQEGNDSQDKEGSTRELDKFGLMFEMQYRW